MSDLDTKVETPVDPVADAQQEKWNEFATNTEATKPTKELINEEGVQEDLGEVAVRSKLKIDAPQAKDLVAEQAQALAPTVELPEVATEAPAPAVPETSVQPTADAGLDPNRVAL